MIKPSDPRRLAEDLLARSTCSVQVAAVLVDDNGRIIAWGWNDMGPTGFGLHAESHCLHRANKTRIEGSTIYVAGQRKKSENPVLARPCDACMAKLISYKVSDVWYRDRDGTWKAENIT